MQLSTAGRQTALVMLLCLLMVMITRLPLFPTRLFSFDSVNFALALEEFDPNRNQPQPPGYPFFVAEARLVQLFAGSPETTFSFVKILVSTLAVGLTYLVGARMVTPGVGLVAAALLLVNPAFWHSSLASPIRPHLALFSALLAYLFWLATEKNRRLLLLASALLGFSAGFRVELPIILLPLWLWTVWQVADRKLALQSMGLMAAGVALWILSLIVATSAPFDSLGTFARYMFAQTNQSSPITGSDYLGWRRMVGRNLVWYGAGTLCWLWAAPWGLRGLARTSLGLYRLGFLGVWFLPAFLLSTVLHGGSPGHTLAGQVPLCLFGAISICAAEDSVKRYWQPNWPLGAALAGAVLISSLVFFSEHLPVRIGAAPSSGRWARLVEPVRYGMYETSYRQVRWTDQMTSEAFEQIRALKEGTSKPTVVVWSRDAEPVWRKVAYYFPDLPVYALEEAGDPAVPATRATLWKGATELAAFEQAAHTPVPIPPNARIIWLLHGSAGARLRKAVSLSAAPPVYYTDLPPDTMEFDWRSFHFTTGSFVASSAQDSSSSRSSAH